MADVTHTSCYSRTQIQKIRRICAILLVILCNPNLQAFLTLRPVRKAAKFISLVSLASDGRVKTLHSLQYLGYMFQLISGNICTYLCPSYRQKRTKSKVTTNKTLLQVKENSDDTLQTKYTVCKHQL
jgi:hypothetical protein